MKRIALFASIFILAAVPAMAQDAPETATLTAEGTGTVHVAPDTAIVTLGVATRGENPGEALAANNADMARVIEAILAAGVAEADIATTGFSISPVYAAQRPEEYDQPARIVAYEVSNQVTVRIRDLAASGEILDRVVAGGANRIEGIRFDVAEPQPLQDEAIAAAIADARRRAALMAEAAGVRLVRVLSVSSYAGGQPVFEYARAQAAVPIMAGEQAITANATLIFEIAPL